MISGLLAAMVSSTVVMAEINPLSEAELEGVSARGVQIAVQLPGAAEQNINNDSVQASGAAEQGASAMAITNSASSAVDIGQNLAGTVSGINAQINQLNNQLAQNSATSLQGALQVDIDVDPGISGDRQNINNGSVQLSDFAQQSASGVAITNAASSAVNVGQNVAGAGSFGNAGITQDNIQVAKNSALNAHGAAQVNVDATFGWFVINADRQDINNGSTQLNGASQAGASAMAVTNSASSAANVGQNVAGTISIFANSLALQSNDQTATNTRTNFQLGGQLDLDFTAALFGVTVDRQNINNGSVQANGGAQADISAMAATNAASSAVNVGQNIAGGLSLFNDAVAIQENLQVATNSALNGQLAGQGDVSLTPIFGLNADNQNINNGSTQLNGTSQVNAEALALTNSASSAANIGQNIGYVNAGAGFFDFGIVYQTNDQTATNSGVNAQGAIQIDADLGGLEISLGTQNINNGSTQLNDAAQNMVSAMAITNAASSAANVGQNVAAADDGWFGWAYQMNLQIAENRGVNVQGALEADIDAITLDYDVGTQNINNGSVQISSIAQADISAMAATNAASSAVNVGQNMASVGWSSFVSLVDQTNDQTATVANVINGQGAGQVDVDILAISMDAANQNINNGSVQLNNAAQSDAEALALTNSASSAVNVGQNIAAAGANWFGDIDQTNTQYASSAKINAQLAGQVQIDILAWSENAQIQNINNGSVQLNDNAQQNASGMAITNASSSAVNVGQNIAGVASGFIGSITQTNTQTALNW